MVVRVGLIGAGSMGALHARVLAGSAATELAWIADPERVTGERLAERFASRWIPEPDISRLDAVVIAAPTEFHHGCAMAIVEAGLPLLVEKPIADSLTRVAEVIEASRRGSTG